MNQPPPLRPVMLVGLGPLGLNTLREVAQQAAQTYGDLADNSVTGLVVDLAERPPAPLPRAISYRALYVDLADLIRSEAIFQPHLIWFDAARHRRELGSTLYAADHPQDRQLVRLALFHHLNTGAGLLKDLAENLRRTQKGRADGSVTVYVVAALSEGASTLALDMATLLRRVAAREHIQALRVALYLATPEALPGEPDPLAHKRQIAQAYAALREIRRFSQDAPFFRHALNYSGGTAGGVLTGTSLKGFDTVHLFIRAPQPAAADASRRLAAVIADTLLCQMDNEFGPHLVQIDENLANGIVHQQEEAVRQGLPPELYVNLREVRTVQFPRQALHDAWQPSLAVDGLRHSLGIDITDTAALAVLERWIDNKLQDRSGSPLRCPSTLALLYDWFRRAQNPQADLAREVSASPASALEKWFVPTTPAPSPSAGRSASLQVLNWRPSERILLRKQPGGAELIRQDVPRQLLEMFGSLEHNTPRTGLYAGTIGFLANEHAQQFADSLFALAQMALASPDIGLAGLRVIANALVESLAWVQKTLQEALRLRHQRAYTEFTNMPNALRDAGLRVERLYHPLWRSKQDDNLAAFLQLADQVSEQLQAETLIAALQQETVRHQQAAEQLADAVAPWVKAMITDRSSLWRKVSSRKTANASASPEVRMSLIDPEWINARYSSSILALKDSALTHLLSNLKWEWQPDPLRLTASLGEKPFHTEKRPDWSSHNVSLWEQTVSSAINATVHRWNIWSYLLDRQSRRSSPAAIVETLAGVLPLRGVQITSQQEWGTYLLTPSLDSAPKSHREFVESLLDALDQTLAGKETYEPPIIHKEIRNDVQFGLLLDGKPIPLSSLDFFGTWQAAYSEFFRRSEDFHIFSAEQNACLYERERMIHLDLKYSLIHDRVVSVLDRRAYLVDFVWADALGLIGIYEFEMLNRYALELPADLLPAGGVYPLWWLGSPAASPSHLDALVAFCELAAESSENPDTIPVGMVRQAVRQAIQIKVQRWRDKEIPDPVTDVWPWVQGLLGSRNEQQALEEAFAYEQIGQYYSRMLEEWRAWMNSTTTERHDLMTLVLTAARQEQQTKYTLIHKMGR